MVNFLASYFFDKEPRVLMNRYIRPTGETIQSKTIADIPGKRMLDTDLYLLVSNNTASACESFPYTLQQFGRAKVVGERTAGAGSRHSVAKPAAPRLRSVDIDSWRMTIKFIWPKDVTAVFTRLNGTNEIASLGGFVEEPEASETTLLVYASTREEVAQIVSVLRSELQVAEVTPTSFVVDQWLPEQGQWSGDRRSGSWTEAIGLGLLDGLGNI